ITRRKLAWTRRGGEAGRLAAQVWQKSRSSVFGLACETQWYLWTRTSSCPAGGASLVGVDLQSRYFFPPRLKETKMAIRWYSRFLRGENLIPGKAPRHRNMAGGSRRNKRASASLSLEVLEDRTALSAFSHGLHVTADQSVGQHSLLQESRILVGP